MPYNKKRLVIALVTLVVVAVVESAVKAPAGFVVPVNVLLGIGACLWAQED